jgi:hypothetical protein
MPRRTGFALVVSLLCLLPATASAAAAPTALLVSQSIAFSFLGHSCGGIQEQSYATDFDPGTGYPQGDVYAPTRCGGSGRGGGYHTTTYSAWIAVTWDFSGGVVSDARATAVSVNPTFSAYDAHGDEIYNQSTRAYLVVLPPAAPTGVAATASGGQYQVSWTADPTAGPVITSSTVTATPVGSAAAAVSATASGGATTAVIGPLQPLTTYDITVTSNSAGGPSPASAPVEITTAGSSTPPGAPSGVSARWTAPGSPSDTLVASWQPGASGDSPTDSYEVTITDSDSGSTFTQTVDGSTLTASFSVSDIPDWSIQVRAHDAAGWGPWSATAFLGGV